MDILSDIRFRNAVVGRSFSTFALPKCAQSVNGQNACAMVNRDFRNSSTLCLAVFRVISFVSRNKFGYQLRIRNIRDFSAITAIAASARFQNGEHLFFFARIGTPFYGSANSRQVNAAIPQHKVISIGAIFYLNGSNNRISIICGIQVPNDAIGVSRIIVQRVPSFTPLQNNSNIAIAAEIFQRPALIRIVCTAKKVNCFTVFYGTILVIAQNIHILTCCHILQLIVVVKFVCHL